MYIHTIYETVLTQLVLEDIREKARFAEYDPDRLMGEILRLKEKNPTPGFSPMSRN